MADETTQEKAPKRQSKSTKTTDPLIAAREASSENGKPTEPDAAPQDESAGTFIYPADIGFTVTSHGDGTPTISPDYIEAAQDEADRNADPDWENKETARALGLQVD